MKFIIATIAVATLMLGAAGSAQATDFKQDYCDGQDYIGAENRYPHLHCAQDWVTLSTLRGKKKDHKYIVKHGDLNADRASRACELTPNNRLGNLLDTTIRQICIGEGEANGCGC